MDVELRKFFNKVQTGVVTDAMYLLGLEGWTNGVFPFRPEARLFGKAFTVQGVRIRSKDEPSYSIYDFAEKWEKDDVLVIDGLGECCSLMGENVAHVCKNWGLSGIVLYGCCRDYGQIRDMDLPVFGMGAAMELKNKRFKFGAYNVTVNIAGAQVRPGDYVLGDIDGVLVMPPERLEDIRYQCEMIEEVEAEMEVAVRNKRPISELKAIIAKKKYPRK
jgi:regulator of RNase E activity RraA